MKRADLYARVWAEPMSHLANEFGMSGAGLAKLCHRHGIPTPPRGHWAKLQAGRASPQPPLPEPGTNLPVALPTPGQRLERTRKRAFDTTVRSALEARALQEQLEVRAPGLAASATAAPESNLLSIPASLERPHPLVRATAIVVERLPGLLARRSRATSSQLASGNLPYPPLFRNGRHELDVKGGLAMTASLATMDWILRFVDALLKELRRNGVHIERSMRAEDRVAVLRLKKSDEELVLSPFVEGYRREEIEATELVEIQKKDRWASKWRYWPSGRISFSMQGSERAVRSNWSGTPVQLEPQLGNIAATCLELIARQPEFRRERETGEAARRREAERQARLRRQDEARRQQLKSAFEASAQYEQELTLRRFLDMLERTADSFQSPTPDRLRVWLDVVRAELKASSPWLGTLGRAILGYGWQTDPPDWWPQTDSGSISPR